jgi:uroporphyrin-III C-methyltransferase
MELLKKADVILYDRLVNPEVFRYARAGAKLISVGKEPGQHIIDQESINKIIAAQAKNNKIVVRLKGGDPFVLGRGGEEAQALHSMGIDFEIIPGVTSAIAVPEAAGIPITDRRASSSFTIVTGHATGDKRDLKVDFTKLEADTIIILMGLGNLERIVKQLLMRRRKDTPVAIIEKGTMENEKVVVDTLEDIVSRVKREGIRAPTIIVVGDVVNLRKEIKS